MNNKLIKIAIIGKTKTGKSTLINSLVGEKISIVNKKINTTLDLVIGIKNINNCQIIFYDTPGVSFTKKNHHLDKKIFSIMQELMNNVDLILYLIDTKKYKYDEIQNNLIQLSKFQTKICLVFNKTDLIINEKILSYINELKSNNIIHSFFNISAKLNKGTKNLIKYFSQNALKGEWKYDSPEK